MFGASGDLFVYPTPPDTLMALQPRSNYIISRFWDRCNFSTAFKDTDKLNVAFGDWAVIMPYASADTVFSSIDRLLARFDKKGPETLILANMAENWFYSDSSELHSPDVYLPFAKAAAKHKKISKIDRARFEAQVKIIESSSVGARVPDDLPFIGADGSNGTFGDFHGGSILLFFSEPDCMDCNFSRIRLSADPNTRELIERHELTIVNIYPGSTNDDAWAKTVAEAPDGWITVAMPSASEYFELRHFPLFIYLNSRHRVLANDMGIDYLLNAFLMANMSSKSKPQTTNQ